MGQLDPIHAYPSKKILIYVNYAIQQYHNSVHMLITFKTKYTTEHHILVYNL